MPRFLVITKVDILTLLAVDSLRCSGRKQSVPLSGGIGVSSYIKEKDQKILWARAAGRCSFHDCRTILTFDAESQAATLGAMCHIVGEKETAARGISHLTIEERNSYTNLLLLCSHHHDIIDRDESKYPVEVLHQIKFVHETWVQECLSGPDVSPDEIVYADLIDAIVQALYLDQWEDFIDHAVRDLLPKEVFDFRGELNRRLLSTLFPEKKPNLDASIKTVIAAYSDYVTHFESRAEPKRENWIFWGRDLSYARFKNPNYEAEVEKEHQWSMRNFWLLCDLVLKLNVFCDAVRESFNPMFYRVYGHFLILDSLGYRFDGENTLYKPIRDEVDKELKNWLATMQPNHSGAVD
jgi:hypothetical protein